MPSNLVPTIDLPASKSECNRYLILCALCQNPPELINISAADDTEVLQKILKNIHATPDIDCHDAGTVARFLAAYLSIQSGTFVLRGSERLQQRPMGILVDALRTVGAQIDYLEKPNCLPLQIVGKKLLGGTINIDASVSSQYISALMLIAPTLPQGLHLVLNNTVSSQPYIQLTAQCLMNFGIQTQITADEIIIKPQNFAPPAQIICEADWSAASYWYGWVGQGAVDSLILPKLYKNTTQGDAQIADIFEKLGVRTTFLPNNQGVLLEKIRVITQNLVYDCTPTPDLAPTLMSYCALQNIAATLTGLHTLRLKESNRAVAMQQELNKFSIKMQLINDQNTAIIHQKNTATTPTEPMNIHTHNDHRIAMAMSLWAGQGYELNFDDGDVVKKSYPDYWVDVAKIKI